MADPFKAAVGRNMRTTKKSDAQGDYYDVNVSGGGGDAPVPGYEDAPPTVLDPQRDYGPPLPPGSVGYGDEEGPIQADDDSNEMDEYGEDPSGTYGLPGDIVAQEDPTLMERIRRWLGSQGADVQPASQDVSEGLNEALPRDLSGRDAVLKKRQQLKKLDEDTKDS